MCTIFQCKQNISLAYAKSLSISMTTVFDEIPESILIKILEKLELIDRLVIRKTSKKFRTTVDNLINIKIIRITVKNNFSRISLDNYEFEYDNVGDHCIVAYGNISRNINGVDHKNFAFGDLNMILNMSKLELKELQIIIICGLLGERESFMDIFENLDSIHSRKCTIEGFNSLEISRILSFFKAGVLEEIDLCSLNSICKNKEIIELEQWKKALKLVSRSHVIQVENLLSFKEFEVYETAMTKRRAVKIRDVLTTSTSLETGTFEFASFFNLNQIATVFNPTFNMDNFVNSTCIDFTNNGGSNFLIHLGPRCLKIEKNLK
ncbi:F-box domain-containing protein [Caenorhabditis elegans]|uniref:F-box domain-containing protein n=1 Tax=Caenorhabditis elegans TaxID=6239 RepID=Q9XW66_CAEEL|nr:F-box domain-containing protein [Caenorhabditis elegans]CAA22105.2 F-box domain-containing protein [Caenorhabditis elegans]|eukprot:NP_499593.2 F-box A protein [Caenorhabditis elegans]